MTDENSDTNTTEDGRNVLGGAVQPREATASVVRSDANDDEDDPVGVGGDD